MPDEVMVRPELIELNELSRQRVLQQITVKGGYCESCRGTEFDVGRALYLGFLFRNEDTDAYMVALTCRNPECPKPRSAIVLHEREFVAHGEGAAG